MKSLVVGAGAVWALMAVAGCEDNPDGGLGIAQCEAIAGDLQYLLGYSVEAVNFDQNAASYIESGQAMEAGRDDMAGNLPIGVVAIQYDVAELAEIDAGTIVERVYCNSE